jgi:YesN/AraC family two-component response regulator
VTSLGVLIVDDEEDMRVLVRNLIKVANHGLSVAGEAADGDEALRRWRDQSPEVVLLDQRMPGLSGLETAELMLREKPHQAVILFTAYLDPDVKSAAEHIGVRACVAKTDVQKVITQLRECAA